MSLIEKIFILFVVVFIIMVNILHILKGTPTKTEITTTSTAETIVKQLPDFEKQIQHLKITTSPAGGFLTGVGLEHNAYIETSRPEITKQKPLQSTDFTDIVYYKTKKQEICVAYLNDSEILCVQNLTELTKK